MASKKKTKNLQLKKQLRQAVNQLLANRPGAVNRPAVNQQAVNQQVVNRRAVEAEVKTQQKRPIKRVRHLAF